MIERKLKDTEMKNKEIVIQRLQISEICGIHPEIEKILSKAGASDLINDPIPVISSADVERYTARNQITLHLYRKKLYVVDNIRAYIAVCQLDDPNLSIFVSIYYQRMNNKVRELIRNELLIYPSLNKRSFHPTYIYLIHKWMIASSNYNGIDRVPNSKCGFARWIGCDVRKLG